MGAGAGKPGKLLASGGHVSAAIHAAGLTMKACCFLLPLLPAE